MAHWFVSSRRGDVPRWHSAFPDGQLTGTEQARARVQHGDHAWLMTDCPEWPAMASSLASQGAIVLALSLAPSEQEAMLALQSGARGYAHALLAPNLLQQAALVTANQGVWVPAELLNRVLGATFKGLGGAERVSQELLSELTERERAVAMAVAEGVSNKEVARRLNITERTVKAHLGAVFRKTGVRDRMQLLLKLAVQDERIA